MLSLDPTLTQPRHHAVDVLFGYAERNVVLRRAAVDQRVDAKKSKHPALPRLGIKQKSTRPIAPAKAELESELVNVELDCAIKVNHRKVHLVQPAMKMVARSESVQGLTRHKISDRETCATHHESEAWMANTKSTDVTLSRGSLHRMVRPVSLNGRL